VPTYPLMSFNFMGNGNEEIWDPPSSTCIVFYASRKWVHGGAKFNYLGLQWMVANLL
jgi:hypothetical protein